MATIATLGTKDIHGGLQLHVRVSRSYTFRMKVAIWLIRIAGRVMDMPCEIDMVSRNAGREVIKPSVPTTDKPKPTPKP